MTKARSILSTSTSSRVRCASAACPAPKSSRESRTPTERSPTSTSTVRSTSPMTTSSETSSSRCSGSKAWRSSRRVDLAGQPEVEQVGGAEVHGDADVVARPAQAADLPQRAVEHEGRQRAREAALLHERQELARPEQPALRMLPAHERLHPAHRPGLQRGLRLVVDDELARPQRAVQLADQREPAAAVVVARRQVDLVAGAHPLGLVHGHVRALQEPERVAGVLGEERDADARVHVDADVADLERALERRPEAQPGRARRRLVARARGRPRTRRRRAAPACRARAGAAAGAARSGAGPRPRRGGRACR